LIAGFEIAESDCMLDLRDELVVGRYARGGVERELDRRHRDAVFRKGSAPSASLVAILFYYAHSKRVLNGISSVNAEMKSNR
jgi:hypothetical protein